MFFHKEVLTISYKHRFEIKKFFKHVLGLYSIDHFSLDLVSPEGEMIFFSGTPSHGYEICSRGFGEYDGAISPDYFKAYEFYWWKDVVHRRYHDEINYIRDIKHQFKHGFMLVRHWNDFYMIYSFATKSHQGEFPSVIINQLNHLFRLGDDMYNEMRDIYADYTGRYYPPKIMQFYPFQGGAPVARYDNQYQLSKGGVLFKQPSSIIRTGSLQLVVNNK